MLKDWRPLYLEQLRKPALQKTSDMAEARFDVPGKFRQFDVHHWADWVELCCVENLDGSITRKEMERRLRLKRSLQTKKVKISEEAPETDQTTLDAAPEDEDIIETEEGLEEVADWFKHLETRSKFLGDAYPFSVNENGTRLDFTSKLTENHWIYLSLLMMANLHYFGEIESTLTSDFEQMCSEALKQFFPTTAEVHVFGKGRAAASRYTGNIFQRIEKLAGDLSGNLIAKQEDFPPTSTGDAGLDLIAWVPLDDPAPGRFAIFGQCACTPEWTSKQHSSAPPNWCAGKMHLQIHPVNAVFTPFYLRDLDGEWHRPATDFGPYLHIDRLRLTSIFKKAEKKFPNLSTVLEAQKIASVKAKAF
jgi:hypothetical protein